MKPFEPIDDKKVCCPLYDNIFIGLLFLSIANVTFLPLAAGYWIWTYKISKFF
jgi:hypothetical protein